MAALIARDDVQLRRLEKAIMRIENGSAAERRKLACLLAALETEKAEILRFTPWARRAHSPHPRLNATVRRCHSPDAIETRQASGALAADRSIERDGRRHDVAA